MFLVLGSKKASVPGRMSTGRGILPSYLGLCWCNSNNNELPVRAFETGCQCGELAAPVLCELAVRSGRQCCELAARVAETWCWVL